MRAGLRLAFGTFTVLPVPAGRVDRRAAGAAMALAPLVGLLLGAALAGVALGLRALGAPTLVVAALVVAAELLLTRALHVDGLADTVDALGSYADRDRALAIMRSPEVGPFGMAAIGVDLLVRTAAVAALLGRPWWALL
ncbi:MAG TPA: adenosylcobinamide-GDP ribazoletransferase, partial [Rugosimonospora sp.]|nr:adenosylcobinamide-GDP ribazoletransferase [Rugosimonospora sp.]